MSHRMLHYPFSASFRNNTRLASAVSEYQYYGLLRQFTFDFILGELLRPG